MLLLKLNELTQELRQRFIWSLVIVFKVLRNRRQSKVRRNLANLADCASYFFLVLAQPFADALELLYSGWEADQVGGDCWFEVCGGLRCARRGDWRVCGQRSIRRWIYRWADHILCRFFFVQILLFYKLYNLYVFSLEMYKQTSQRTNYYSDLCSPCKELMQIHWKHRWWSNELPVSAKRPTFKGRLLVHEIIHFFVVQVDKFTHLITNRKKTSFNSYKFSIKRAWKKGETRKAIFFKLETKYLGE